MTVTIGRRALLAALGGAAAAWPLAARAQARRPLVGYLAGVAPASVMRSTTALAFVNGLREQGYIEGRDLDIAYKFADGFLDRLPALAEQLVKLGRMLSWRLQPSRRWLRKRRRLLFLSYVLCLRTRSGSA